MRPLAVGDHQPAVVADDDLRADRRDRLLALRQVPLVDVVEQRGQVLAVHLAGDGEAQEGQQRGGDVVRGRVPVDVVAALLAVRVADQVRDLVGEAVGGGRWRGPSSRARRAPCRGRRARTRAVSSGHRVDQLAELVVHGLHVLAYASRTRSMSLSEKSSATSGRRSARRRRPPLGRAGRRTAAPRTASIGSNGSTPTKKRVPSFDLARAPAMPSRKVRSVASVSARERLEQLLRRCPSRACRRATPRRRAAGRAHVREARARGTSGLSVT